MNRKLKFAFVASWMLAVCNDAVCQQGDGSIVETSSYVLADYGNLDAFFKGVVNKSNYDLLRATTPTLEKIKYMSDGLTINGFICRPVGKPQEKFPVILYNRPGVGEGAKIGDSNFLPIFEILQLAKHGYVVIASQYRGVDGAAGKDEVGGADLADVLNLVSLAKSLPYANASELFSVGSSRGGSMALQSIAKGVNFRAVAVIGAVTDWGTKTERDENFRKQFWPGYPNNRNMHIESRSALYWPEKITSPLLIMHGTDDRAVETRQALDLAIKLQENGKTYKLVIFPKGDHIITTNELEKLDLIISWFDSHKS